MLRALKALTHGRSEGGQSLQAPTEGPPGSPHPAVEVGPPWGPPLVGIGGSDATAVQLL